MVSIYLNLLSYGQLSIKVVTDSKEKFFQVNEKLKSIPVIEFDKKRKCLISNIYFLDRLYRLFSKYNWDYYTTTRIEEYKVFHDNRLERIVKARDNKEFSSKYWTDNPDCKMHDYQAQAINLCWTAKRYLQGDDCGCGKTIVAIGLACKAFENDYTKALMVVNNRLKYQWKSEILKFTKFTSEEVVVIDPAAKITCPLKLTDNPDFRTKPCRGCELIDKCRKGKDVTKKVTNQLKSGKLVIINWEALDKYKKIIIKYFDQFYLDEATRMKNYTAKMCKAMYFIEDNVDKDSIFIPMSGTFIENRAEEIYPAMRLVDKRLLGNFTNFKNRYLITDYFGNVLGYRREKELRKLIDLKIIRRELCEVWKDHPDLIEGYRYCEMTEKQRDIYDAAKEGALKDIKDKALAKKINITEIAPLISYLIRICDTTETIDNTKKESGKMDVLKEILTNEIGKKNKVIIFTFFGNEVAPILQREVSDLKIGKCLKITGKTTQKDAEELKRQFIHDPECRFLVCSDALSYGANLQCANYVINYDLPWNPAKLYQRIARCFRQGQTQTVYAINMVTKDSVEDMIVEKIFNKKKIFKMFLGKNEEEIKEEVVKHKSVGLGKLLEFIEQS